jgi:signal transduction histidine kinase
MDAKADDYLVKPFSARELLARVSARLAIADIQKEADKAVRESEGRLRALLNATSYVIYRMSPDWKEMRQLDGKGFISDTQSPTTDWMREYIPEKDQPMLEKAIDEAIRTKSLFELEHQVKRPDGTLGWTLSRAIPLLNEQGEITEWFGAASDMTERREAEENYRSLAETLDVEVRERTKQLEKRNADVTRQAEQVRDLSRRLLRAQDEERRHIARELHDSAGQMLTVLGMNLAEIRRQAIGKAPALMSKVEESDQLLQQLHREIRTMSYLLHPPLLDESGLGSALAWYTQGLTERSGLNIVLRIPEAFGRIPRDMELVIFRLIQECLTNIHRHSGAKDAWITVAREPGGVAVVVGDSGKGIGADRLAEIQSGRSGVGFGGMRERVGQFQGEMKIESTEGGTTVSFRIPVLEQANSKSAVSA